MWNASIFCPKGKTPWEDVKREYVRKVFDCSSHTIPISVSKFYYVSISSLSCPIFHGAKTGFFALTSKLIIILCFISFIDITLHCNSFPQSILWDNDLKSTKQTIKEMIMHYSCLEFPEGKGVNKCDTIADLA